MTQSLITGVLLDPLSNPAPDVDIRFTATSVTGEVIVDAVAVHTTGADGSYEFYLMYGTYLMEIKYSDEYALVVNVVLDESAPASLTLSELVHYAAIVPTREVIHEDPNWEALYDALRNAPDTVNRDKITQLKDGDLTVSDNKKLFLNDASGTVVGETVSEIGKGTTEFSHTSNVLNTLTGMESVVDAVSMRTLNSIRKNTVDITEASNGNTQYHLNNTYDTNEVSLATTLLADVVGVTKGTSVDFGGTSSTATITYNVDGYTSIAGVTKDTASSVITDTLTSTTVGKTATGTITTDVGSGIFEEVSEITVVDGEVSGTVGNKLTVYGKEASVTTSNDGFNTKHVVKADETSYQGSDGEELLNIDAVNNTVTLKGKLLITNPEDFKGETGESRYHVYQYSITNSADAADWHETYVSGADKWRRYAEVINGIQGDWSVGILLNAVDGLPGDTLYIEYQYSNNKVNWHEVMWDGDVWRRERTILNGTPTASWSTPARMRGVDGNDAGLVQIEYQYAVDLVDPEEEWHYNFSTGDCYRRERLIYFYSTSDREAYIPISNPTYYQATLWSNAGQIAPKKGVDYGYKHATVYLYQNKKTTPIAPTATVTYNFLTLAITGLSEGWDTSIPAGTGDIWVAVASAWTLDESDVIEPNEWVIERLAAVGRDGVTGIYSSYIYKNSATVVTTVPNEGAFNGVDETIPTGWTDNPVTPEVGEVAYVSTARYEQDSDTEEWERIGYILGDSSGWSTPARFSGFVGDTKYIEYQYSADGSLWHDDLLSTDYYKRERAVLINDSGTTYTEFTEGVLIRVDGTPGAPAIDGVDGESKWTEFYFSDDGVSTPPSINWSGTQRSTDSYLISQKYTNGVGEGWSEVTKIRGENGNTPTDGIDGLSGNYVSYIFKTTTTTVAPIQPLDGSYDGTTEIVPTGWSDNPQFEYGKITWVSVIKYANTEVDTWVRLPDAVSPKQWANTSKYVETRYIASVDSPTPLPTGDEPTGWFITPPEVMLPNRVWASSCTKHPTGELDVGWSVPVPWTGYTPKKGTDYVDGKDGSFVSFVFLLSDVPVTPTGGSYNGNTEIMPITDGVSWSDSPIYSPNTKTQVSKCRYINSDGDWVRTPNWSESVQYLGEDGAEGLDGNYISYVFMNAETRPSKPSGGAYNGVYEDVPSGWLDEPEDRTFTLKTWISKTSYSVDAAGSWSRSGWSTPVQWTGENGYNSDHVQLYQVSANEPPIPSNSIEYTFYTGRVSEGDLTNGWQQDYPDNVMEDDKVWTTFNNAFAQVGNDTDYLNASNWSTPVVIQHNSVSTFKSTVFKRSSDDLTSNPPSANSGSWSSPVPTGWEDGIPAGDLQLWGSTRIFTRDGTPPQQSQWTQPRTMSDTETSDYEYSSISLSIDPENPTSQPTWWHDSATPSDNWMARRSVINGVPQSWNVVQIRGEKGKDGASIQGVAGDHGQGSFRIQRSSLVGLTDSIIDSNVAAAAGRSAIDDDMVEYYSDSTPKYTAFYIRESGSWNEFTSFINGNAVIKDTLAASTLRSGDVFTQKLHIGKYTTSDSEVTLSGNGDLSETYARMWAGATMAEDAPFMVDAYGNLRATDANITGVLDVIGGSRLRGAVYFGETADNNSYVEIKGKDNPLGTDSAMSVVKDGITNYRLDYSGRLRIGGASRWLIDIDPVNDIATFNGTFRAENIVGDVYDAKSYESSLSETAYSGAFTSFGGFIEAEANFERTLLIGAVPLSAYVSNETGDFGDPTGFEKATLRARLLIYINGVLEHTTSAITFEATTSIFTAPLETTPVHITLPPSASRYSFEVKVVISTSGDHATTPTISQYNPALVSVFKNGGTLS